jgi:flagellar hook-associated protein 3 FlgL
MRVSNQMMAENVKLNLFRITEKLVKYEEQISTGKRINRISDDPTGIQQVLNYRQQLSSMEQYTENITNAKLHIDTMDTILETVTDLLNDAKGYATDPDPELRTSFAEDVDVIRNQVIQLANSKSTNGLYLFGGDLNGTQPFDSTTGAYSGDNGTKDYLIGEGQTFNITADGSEIFQGTNPDDVFTVLENLQTELALGTGASQANINSYISEIEDAIDQITAVRAGNAGRYTRLDATENHYDYFSVNVENLLSSVEDADMASTIIDFQVQQTAYESTLAASAKIIQPSLIDFLS